MTPSLREIVILFSMSTLASMCWYYGYRFLKLKNDILGIEWMIVGTSATSFCLNRLGLWEFGGQLTPFLDLFSRLIGVPILGFLGVMKLTHGLSFSRFQEFLMFAIGLLVAWAFVVSSTLQVLLPVLFLVLGIAFLALVAYLGQQAFKHGLRLHGWMMVAAVLLNLGIALLQDFVKLPDEDTAIFVNKLVLEGIVWSFGIASMFYAYQALHHAGIRPRGARWPAVSQA